MFFVVLSNKGYQIFRCVIESYSNGVVVIETQFYSAEKSHRPRHSASRVVLTPWSRGLDSVSSLSALSILLHLLVEIEALSLKLVFAFIASLLTLRSFLDGRLRRDFFPIRLVVVLCCCLVE